MEQEQNKVPKTQTAEAGQPPKPPGIPNPVVLINLTAALRRKALVWFTTGLGLVALCISTVLMLRAYSGPHDPMHFRQTAERAVEFYALGAFLFNIAVITRKNATGLWLGLTLPSILVCLIIPIGTAAVAIAAVASYTWRWCVCRKTLLESQVS